MPVWVEYGYGCFAHIGGVIVLIYGCLIDDFCLMLMMLGGREAGATRVPALSALTGGIRSR